MTTTLEHPTTRTETFRIGGELPVDRLGFGAMRLTGDGVWGPPADRDEAIRVLRRAVELGVDFVDTADAYGPHVSEELIAEALHPYPENLVIATKGGLERPGPGEWEPNGRPEHLRSACEGSLRRLRRERIDLYQLHRIDPEVPAEDQFATLVELRDEGKIRCIGLSNVTVDDIEAARRHFPVATVQNQYNLTERAADPVVEFCTEEGIGFIPWFPLAAGKVLSEEKLAAVARRHDATPAQVALAWHLARTPISLPIPGTSRVEHLEENLGARHIELSGEDLAALDGIAG